MKEETLNALDMFVRQVERAIKVAIPEATETLKALHEAGQDLRDCLNDETVS